MAIIIARTLIVFITLVVFMRLMGKRQLGQMELPELVIAVLIADLAAHPLQDIGIPLINGILPILVLFCSEVLLSGIAMSSPRFRLLLFGRPSFLVRNGKINQREMRRNRLTLDELTEELRSKSISDIAKLEYALLETDGTLSTMLLPEQRPLTASDIGLQPEDSGYPVILINDGKVMAKNLKAVGRDRKWLQKELEKRALSSPDEVYALLLDGSGKVFFAAREGDR